MLELDLMMWEKLNLAKIIYYSQGQDLKSGTGQKSQYKDDM